MVLVLPCSPLVLFQNRRRAGVSAQPDDACAALLALSTFTESTSSSRGSETGKGVDTIREK